MWESRQQLLAKAFHPLCLRGVRHFCRPKCKLGRSLCFFASNIYLGTTYQTLQQPLDGVCMTLVLREHGVYLRPVSRIVEFSCLRRCCPIEYVSAPGYYVVGPCDFSLRIPHDKNTKDEVAADHIDKRKLTFQLCCRACGGENLHTLQLR